MRVVVLGAGVVGVTTAYYLAKAGCDVTLVDRCADVAAETSRANAGLISVGHALAWGSPRAPRMLLKSIWRPHAGFRMRLRPDPALIRWGLRFLRECNVTAARRNSTVKYRIARYSQACLTALREEAAIDDHRIDGGLLYYYRDPAHFAQGTASLELFRELGHDLEVVDAARCRTIEPALANLGDALAGGVFCATDEGGDCRVFTQRLAERCAALGVSLRLDTTVTRLHRDAAGITTVETTDGPITADRYVLALGSYSPLLARRVGLKLPIYPVKGYSLTLPITDAAAAPRVGGVDEGRFVAFARMAGGLRMTATADFAGYDTAHAPADFDHMMALARQLFPGGVDFDRPGYWACLRPMTPDGPPVLGPTPIANLFLNTGQGHMGWTMACGSSRVVADLMLGRQPEIDLAGLTYARFH